MTDIHYSLEPGLAAAEFIELLRQSTLAERRPVDEIERMERMLRNADIILTAHTAEHRLVGVSRAITDFAYCTYLSDLAVAHDFSGGGLGGN